MGTTHIHPGASLHTPTVPYDPTTGSVVNLQTLVDDAAAPTAARTSVLYNGGGASNALLDNQATSALPAGAATITVGENNLLEVQVFDATATETLTLCVAEYSASTPTPATLIRQVAVSLGSDEGRTVDRACVGLVTGTEIYAKQPARIAVTPGSYINLCIIENVTGAVYARYTLGVE